jgi:hypothetical protein
MEESARDETEAASVLEERSCPNMGQPLEQTNQDRPKSDEEDKKKMSKNGGLRPGKKWPQYLAANLGNKTFHLSYKC